jgi:hypothetical protein
MWFIRFVFLFFILTCIWIGQSLAQFSGSALIPSGSLTSGHCLQSSGGILVSDAGAACGSGGGGVAQLLAGTGITLSPSGGTGTVTVTASGAGVSQIIAGTNVTISPSGGTGAVTVNASGGSGNLTTLTFASGTTITPPNGFETCYRSQAIAAVPTGTRLKIRAIVQRSNGTEAYLAVVNSSGVGFVLDWSSSNSLVLYRNDAGSGTSLSTVSASGTPFSPAQVVYDIELIGDTTNGLNINAGQEGASFSGWKQDNTYNLNSGSWYVCAGTPTFANIASGSYATGPLP